MKRENTDSWGKLNGGRFRRKHPPLPPPPSGTSVLSITENMIPETAVSHRTLCVVMMRRFFMTRSVQCIFPPFGGHGPVGGRGRHIIDASTLFGWESFFIPLISENRSFGSCNHWKEPVENDCWKKCKKVPAEKYLPQNTCWKISAWKADVPADIDWLKKKALSVKILDGYLDI